MTEKKSRPEVINVKAVLAGDDALIRAVGRVLEAQLSGWSGDTNDPGFRNLVEAVQHALGTPAERLETHWEPLSALSLTSAKRQSSEATAPTKEQILAELERIPVGANPIEISEITEKCGGPGLLDPDVLAKVLSVSERLGDWPGIAEIYDSLDDEKRQRPEYTVFAARALYGYRDMTTLYAF